MKPYNKENIPFAQNLRKNMTPWERKLWYDYLRHYPVRFQRQKAIGNYIVDFYCAKAHLVIELDGSGHYETEEMEADRIRTRDLEDMNLNVLRICNLDVDKNFSGVCEYIDMAVQKALPQSASLTAPSTEEAFLTATPKKTIYALGLFDGVHLGHQALLTACRELAQAHNCQAGVVTFTSHPDALVSGQAPALINTQEERKALLQLYGIRNILELPFDRALKTTHWSSFLNQLLQHDATGFVCGSDFRFGAGGSGTAKKLEGFCRSRGLPCCVVPEQVLDGVRISSTHIRSLLENGHVEQAARFLGHPHVLTGCVAPGQKLGRTMGTPTANLSVPAGQLCLKHGVYACKAFAEGQVYLAVTNVGMRPTVAGDHVTVESWLLDFEGDLYGKTLTLAFHKFLRPEVKFDSLDGLMEQIQTDAQQTRQLLTGETPKV